MNNEKTMQRVLLLSGMIALLLLAFLFEYVMAGLLTRSTEEAGMEPVLISLYTLFEILLVLGGLALAWYLLSSGGAGKVIKIVFLIVGLLTLALFPMLFFLPVPEQMYALVQFVQPRSYPYHAGGILATAGLLGLVLKRKR